MKKLFFFTIICVSITSMLWSQEDVKTGVIRELSIASYDDSVMQLTFIELLNDENFDIGEYITPGLLRAFSSYNSRQSNNVFSKVFVNRKLILLLDYIAENAASLGQSDGYVYELRKIVQNYSTQYTLLKALDAYGAIIQFNPPSESGAPGVSVYDLFAMDVTDALAKASIVSDFKQDVLQATYIALPYLRYAISQDENIVYNGFFIRNFLFLARYHMNPITRQEFNDLYAVMIRIEMGNNN